jgi:hypothetical protein
MEQRDKQFVRGRQPGLEHTQYAIGRGVDPKHPKGKLSIITRSNWGVFIDKYLLHKVNRNAGDSKKILLEGKLCKSQIQAAWNSRFWGVSSCL